MVIPLMKRTVFIVIIAFALCASSAVRAASEECEALFPKLTKACPAFQFLETGAVDSVLEPVVSVQNGPEELFDSIESADFSASCCGVVAQLSASRCGCDLDAIDGLQTKLGMDLLALALSKAAEPSPAGCGITIAPSGPKECQAVVPTSGTGTGVVSGNIQPDDGIDGTRKMNAVSSECKDGKTVLQILSNFPGFGGLISAVKRNQDLVDILEGQEPITMFAPINFDGKGTVIELDTTIKRHILLGNFPIKELDPEESYTSANSEKLEFSEKSGKPSVNGVPILQKDIEACNGRVHVVEKPLPSLGSAPAEETSISQGGQSNGGNAASLCRCSENGVIGGVDTGRPGCGQHLLNNNLNLLFCYVSDAKACADSATVTISPSEEFKDVSWRECSLEEAKNLPALQDLISKDVKALNPGWSLLRGGKVPSVLRADGPYTVFVPSELAIGNADLDVPEAKLEELARHHIVSGQLSIDALLSMEESDENTLVTLDGTPLTLSKDRDGAIIIDGSTHIQLGDLFASNGVAHMVNAVLMDESSNKGGLPKPTIPGQRKTPQTPSTLQPPVNAPQPANPTVPSTPLPAPNSLLAAARRGSKQPPTVVSAPRPVGPLTSSAAAVGGVPVATVTPQSKATRRSPVNGLPGKNPCACSEDGVSGGVRTKRPGCKRHIEGGPFFCYVEDPVNCPSAQASEGFPGTKIKPCSEDPCACTTDGRSGTVNTGFIGCAKHIVGQPDLCYVVDPKKCKTGRRSDSFPGAEWRFCSDGAAVSALPVSEVRPKPVRKPKKAPPCSCTKDGKSGGVETDSIGCGRYGAFGIGTICFVVDPSMCTVAAPSLRYPGASWKIC